MSEDTEPGPRTVQLPEALDLPAAVPLAEQLLGCVGEDLVIDARAAQRLGASCLQVLLAAARTWKAEGNSVSLESPSDRFLEDLRLLGFEPETLLTGVASS
jgi:chemotaxis protein CheX